MELLDQHKTDIYGDDLYLFFLTPIHHLAIRSLIGEAILIGKQDDGSWHIFAEQWENETLSFECNTAEGSFIITFDDLGDYEIN